VQGKPVGVPAQVLGGVLGEDLQACVRGDDRPVPARRAAGVAGRLVAFAEASYGMPLEQLERIQALAARAA
jgi:hypothetical protein